MTKESRRPLGEFVFAPTPPTRMLRCPVREVGVDHTRDAPTMSSDSNLRYYEALLTLSQKLSVEN